jgi:flavin-binding protein dodecin
MTDEHVYRMIELAGSSENSIEEALQNAIARASKTLHGLRWFEVVETAVTSRVAESPTTKS